MIKSVGSIENGYMAFNSTMWHRWHFGNCVTMKFIKCAFFSPEFNEYVFFSFVVKSTELILVVCVWKHFDDDSVKRKKNGMNGYRQQTYGYRGSVTCPMSFSIIFFYFWRMKMAFEIIWHGFWQRLLKGWIYLILFFKGQEIFHVTTI